MSAEQEFFADLKTPIGGVPAPLIMAAWDRVEPLLRRVVKPHTGYSLDQVLTLLQLEQFQLWVIGDFQAVAVTELQKRPLHKVLWCQFLAGDNIDEWLDDWDRVQTEFARHHGCVAVEFSGRPGWRKHQKKFDGYKPILTTFRKEL